MMRPLCTVALACLLPAACAGAPQPRPRAASFARASPPRTAGLKYGHTRPEIATLGKEDDQPSPPLATSASRLRPQTTPAPVGPRYGHTRSGIATWTAAPLLLQYERNGHIATSGLLSSVEAGLLLAELGAEHERRRAQTRAKLLADHGPNQRKGDVPFEQLFNSWLANGAARALVGSERLALTAAQLLGVAPGQARLYQDTLLVKRAGHGATLWHTDGHMCPIETNRFVSCWIALSPVPREKAGGSALVFADQSHRDYASLYWGESEGELECSGKKYTLSSHAPLQPGDATWHDGWVQHAAPPNRLKNDRWAFAISFFADGARTLTSNQRRRMNGETQTHTRAFTNKRATQDSPSYARWLPDLDEQSGRLFAGGGGGAQGGVKAVHAHLPLVPWTR
ncbi:hypothetical protein T492DRAFT_921858 [Pavlovales sp. CCMP2436]|nr:hypothetical protein T492DRAFT_921858 [Pavlovales sp. CCMP2436]